MYHSLHLVSFAESRLPLVFIFSNLRVGDGLLLPIGYSDLKVLQFFDSECSCRNRLVVGAHARNGESAC